MPKPLLETVPTWRQAAEKIEKMILSRCDKGYSIVRLASVTVEIICFTDRFPVELDL